MRVLHLTCHLVCVSLSPTVRLSLSNAARHCQLDSMLETHYAGMHCGVTTLTTIVYIDTHMMFYSIALPIAETLNYNGVPALFRFVDPSVKTRCDRALAKVLDHVTCMCGAKFRFQRLLLLSGAGLGFRRTPC